mmetsp:Transcript_107299/g.310221  ORF Transcript_107299/g.310221 Transcript_107299/m.310221 type:complete len:98 (-) Transcript_107299:40-333(-)|eukprot:CAMPEP_0176121124 /NCGR_PEP_ID=MMETSP0120_2-20121206/60953_1 /TAXON_ID=160619 /ORGANISM="Kryptoperidinium foliaceum, Strain CCMP 1326" /LENGTH=97 /DNA_ID=CAMNT_0017455639 /DNA_START=48 /DNA_END=341 /DNA_ORIENTATION=-
MASVFTSSDDFAARGLCACLLACALALLAARIWAVGLIAESIEADIAEELLSFAYLTLLVVAAERFSALATSRKRRGDDHSEAPAGGSVFDLLALCT